MAMASQASDWCEEELSFPAPLTTLCSRGHHASLLLCTTQGGHMCLACFSDLLSQRSAFVIHKAYALTEFLQALQDDAFCSSFLQHRHFLVPSLSEALYRCTDEGLAEAIMEAIQRLCRLASGDTILLNDFIAHLSLQLASQVLVWSCGQRFVLHSLGSLIDLHGRHAVYLPEVLRAPEFFLSNLLSGLRLPGDDIRGEILFVLYKLSSLQEGINELLKYCPQCIHLAVNALLKTEDDELRTNGIAFLSVMAQSSVYDIGLVLDDEISSQEFSETATTCESTLCFAKIFAEAMKGSLMSTDIQVQVSSIQLICQVCPVRADLQNEIRILVEAGISEYIFEILRVSEDILQIANVAIGALITLSAAGDLFTQRLIFGVEAVIRVLESFIEPNWMVQKEAMLLLAANISDIPGLLTAGRAESLFLIIKKVLEQHASLVEDLSAHGGGNHLYPETFAAACSAFIALLKVPCCYGLDFVPHVLLLCARSAIASATTSCRFAIQHIVLRSSACILQEASKFSQKRAAGDSSYCTLALSLLDLFEIELLPTISICFENLEEEETALAFIDTCLHFLQSSGPSRNVILAEKLASKSWCSLLYQSMNCFPSAIFKKSAYDVLSAIVDSLAGKELGQLVKAASQNLPSDPIDLLTLMEQNSSQNLALMSTQYAIFAIIYTSHLHNDRLAHEYQILASLDHFIVVNGSNLWNKSPLPAGFGHFVFLYALLKETLDVGTQPCSNEAEKLLIETIKQSHGIQYISSKTPKPVLKWFFCKEPLKPLVMEQLLSWFIVDPFEVFQESRILDSEVEKKNSCSQEWRILSELAAENGFVVKVLVQLFEKLGELLIDKETQTIAFVYIDLMRFSPTIAPGFHQNGLVCSIRSWILKYGSKACASTIMSIFQLLFLLLQTMTPGDLEANGDSWLDIANQAIHLLLCPETVNMRATAQAPSYLYVICLIISKSLESDILAEASYVLCFNKDLLITLWSNIINGIKEPSKLSQLALVNPEEEIICLSLVFHMLWLRV
ncbi:hypothetical protein O6H91_23G018900 [Diphasiastrum complanatum]|nr:hypothetical protein O6H91_23G018900 [Diphasiastrum complanatum]KAJ7513897.1 hypothetical protein O6H91_23G018900 [Diphasiastrum complanatum]